VGNMPSSEITFRWLEPSELSRVDPIIDANGWMQLNANVCRVMVAEENGHILGMNVFQLVSHVGPLWVRPDKRGDGIAEELSRRMYDYMVEIQCRGYVVIAESAHAVKLCEAHGLTRVEHPVYVFIPKDEGAAQ
jgi:GNAT superfamily N-acetyltransferase